MYYWFDKNFVRCILFVFANGIFVAYCALALYRGDYHWLARTFFDAGLCTLGYCFYRYWYPVIRWYYRTVRALALIC